MQPQGRDRAIGQGFTPESDRHMTPVFATTRGAGGWGLSFEGYTPVAQLGGGSAGHVRAVAPESENRWGSELQIRMQQLESSQNYVSQPELTENLAIVASTWNSCVVRCRFCRSDALCA